MSGYFNGGTTVTGRVLGAHAAVERAGVLTFNSWTVTFEAGCVPDGEHLLVVFTDSGATASMVINTFTPPPPPGPAPVVAG